MVLTAGEQVRLLSQMCGRWTDFLGRVDWEKAKAQAECLDYLLEVAVKMRMAGMETEGM
jgi:hypothetical protein